MNSAIYIPKKLNVGFQNRAGTYTGKLAYVIYYDDKNKLRKENSWNGWRDKDIPNEEYDNEPTEGFVLNKKVGDYSGEWGNHRHAYTRIYDPRGFEFEITIENLLWILEFTTSTPGKGLSGEFVYGWDGKDLLLMPCSSPDYKKQMEFSALLNNNETIKAKDLKIGATYLDKYNVEYIYMGKFPRIFECYFKDGKKFKSEYDFEYYCRKNNIEPDNIIKGRYSWNDGKEWYPDKIEACEFDKQHVFYEKKSKYPSFTWLSSLNKKFITCKDEECSSEYAELFEKLECTTPYSCEDKSHVEKVYYTFEEFEHGVTKYMWTLTMYTDSTDPRTKVNSNGNRLFEVRLADDGVNCMIYNYNSYRYKDNKIYSMEEAYEIIKPYYLQRYLLNGKKYTRSAWYE